MFFHEGARTLILTDLVVNLKTSGFSRWQKLLANFDCVAFPDGASPRTLRWTTRDRKKALLCYERMINWAPEKIVISHGECFLEQGTVEVKRRLGWIVSGKPTPGAVAN